MGLQRITEGLKDNITMCGLQRITSVGTGGLFGITSVDAGVAVLGGEAVGVGGAVDKASAVASGGVDGFAA